MVHYASFVFEVLAVIYLARPKSIKRVNCLAIGMTCHDFVG